MSKEQKNNNECEFKLEINGTLFTVNLIQSNGAKLTYATIENCCVSGTYYCKFK